MNVLFSSINSIYRTVQQPPTGVLKNLSGYIFVFCVSKSLLLWEKGDREAVDEELL